MFYLLLIFGSLVLVASLVILFVGLLFILPGLALGPSLRGSNGREE